MIMFEIHEIPKPQKQTHFARGHCYDPSKNYKDMLVWQMRPYAPNEPLSGPLHVDITFLMPIPKTSSASVRRQMIANNLHAIKRPDIDNLAYIITNAMKNLIYKDDSQIVDLHLHKRYAECPRTVVKVTEV